MKNIFKIALVLSILSCALACTKGFEDINKNPNAAESVNASYYMTKVITLSSYQYDKQNFQSLPALVCRYVTKLNNADDDGFNWGANEWDTWYQTLSICKSFYDQAVKEGNEALQAVAEILAVFNWDYVTSCWGDCPYTEALQSLGSGLVYPKYDKQSDIYPDLLSRLAAANDILARTSSTIPADSDILYGGNKVQWQKFCNSLRLRMLLKASKNLSSAAADIKTIAGNKSQYPVFESNADAAEIPYNAQNLYFSGPTNGGLKTDQFKEYIKRRPSKEIIDYMLPREDPRLAALFDKVRTPELCTRDHNEYIGCPIALKTPYTYNGGQDGVQGCISTYCEAKFYQDLNDYVKAAMMIYPEVCFILSEAVNNMGASVPGETAESLYNKGVKASCEYWGVDDAVAVNAFLAKPAVKFDGTQKRILEQKWVSCIIKSAETWSDYRRTNDVIGFNAQLGGGLDESALALRQKFIPYRYIYPDNERSYNNEQYQAGIKVFGADEINTKMWLFK